MSVKNEIVLYQSKELVSNIEVRIEDETVWLSQTQMMHLFKRDQSVISRHINNIFKEGELDKKSNMQKLHIADSDKPVAFYSLDVIISVGYRVKSKEGNQFRIWAESILGKQSTPMTNIEPVNSKIFIIRGVAVMLDRHLAEFYQTETRALKQAVRRNIERFPSDFMFQLNSQDVQSLVSQSVIPSAKYFGGSAPFVFTEQGVSMLSAIIRTPVAVEVSLRIIRAFVEVKNLVLKHSSNTDKRLSSLEQKQIDTDNKINLIFKALEDKTIEPKQGIFYKGQVFDAYKFVSDLIRKAEKSVILIDNYVDDSVLTLLSKRRESTDCKIFTSRIDKQLKLDLQKHNEQYPKIEIDVFKDSHDRFLIIDENELYHFGASLKDLGKKWFAFSEMNSMCKIMLSRLNREGE
jgi:hypothetical protein